MKAILKNIAFRCGFDVHSRASSGNERALLWRLLRAANVDTVIDVGANVGHYARMVFSLAPSVRVISFEPTRAAHERLTKEAIGCARWTIAERMALGVLDGEATVHVSGNSVSSSLLPMAQRHLSAAPSSGYVSHERVQVHRLDAIAPNYISPSNRLLLKIDTQGFEAEVLDGAAGIMPGVVAAQVELSFARLYEGQALAPEIVGRLESGGFRWFAMIGGLREQRSGALLQADGLFVRST